MKILIADDHEMLRSGMSHFLAQAFDCTDVVQAGSLPEAEERLKELPLPDLAIVDFQMPGVQSLDSIAALGEAYPGVKIVIMSAFEGRMEVANALAAGIKGYVPKSLPLPTIAQALREVLDGHVYVPPSATKREMPGLSAVAEPYGVSLTERQQQVLDELMHGKSSKVIARKLDIAEATVKIHLAAIYRALQVGSRAEAIAKVKTAHWPTVGHGKS